MPILSRSLSKEIEDVLSPQVTFSRRSETSYRLQINFLGHQISKEMQFKTADDAMKLLESYRIFGISRNMMVDLCALVAEEEKE